MIFSLAGGGLLGFFAGKAFKVIAKIVAVIIGLIVLVLAYFSYKGWIDVHWQTVQNQTQSAAYNASLYVSHMINETATKFANHPTLAAVADGTQVAGGVGFVAGFLLAVKH